LYARQSRFDRLPVSQFFSLLLGNIEFARSVKKLPSSPLTHNFSSDESAIFNN